MDADGTCICKVVLGIIDEDRFICFDAEIVQHIQIAGDLRLDLMMLEGPVSAIHQRFKIKGRSAGFIRILTEI